MPGIIERLIDEDSISDAGEATLAVDLLIDAVIHNRKGWITNAEVIAMYTLTVDEQQELLDIQTEITAGNITTEDVRRACRLARRRHRELPPDDTAAKIRTRLGLPQR